MNKDKLLKLQLIDDEATIMKVAIEGVLGKIKQVKGDVGEKGDKGDGNIYKSDLNGDVWTVPEKMGSDINTDKSWETSACLTSDGQTLYFVSDREGGYGGRDIYKCVKLIGCEVDPRSIGCDQDGQVIGCDTGAIALLEG